MFPFTQSLLRQAGAYKASAVDRNWRHIDAFLRATEILFNVAKTFKDLQYIDFGSGFSLTELESLGISTDLNFGFGIYSQVNYNKVFLFH